MTGPELRSSGAGEPAVSYTRDQRGWMVAAFIAFVGIAIVGPAAASAMESGRDLRRRGRKRLRQLGGGTVAPLRRRAAALRR